VATSPRLLTISLVRFPNPLAALWFAPFIGGLISIKDGRRASMRTRKVIEKTAQPPPYDAVQRSVRPIIHTDGQLFATG
jgi:hypothetical protein